MPPVEVQDVLSQRKFSGSTQWIDNRRSKPIYRHPDFKHKKPTVALWLYDKQKPAWVLTQLGRWYCGIKRPPESASTLVQGQGAFAAHEGQVEVEMCSKLCDDGRIGDAVDALNILVRRGCHVHNNLFYRILKWCIATKDLVMGRRIHDLSIKGGYEGDAFLATHLMGLYASHGRLKEAMRVFTKVSTPSTYNWSTIILAHARNGEAAEAVRLYRQMRESTVKADNHVYVAVLIACAAMGDLVAGREVHAHVLERPGKPHSFVQTGLFDMYLKCKSLEDARRVFDTLPVRNVVTWNAMLASYAQQGLVQEALTLHSSMQQEGNPNPNSVTFVCLLQACASVGVGALHQGKQLHSQIEELGLQEDVILGGSLVNMYAKCGSILDARRVFDRIPERSVVTWTVMMAGYTQQGMGQEALSLYSSMQQEGVTPPDSVTFVCILKACASVGVEGLRQGKQLHEQIEGRGLQYDVVLGGCLVNMYAKCGSIEDARSVFERLPERNVVAWNAMIAGYAQQGVGEEALSLYCEMQQDGISSPDSFTFVCLLQACGSVGDGALCQGKRLHAEILDRGLRDDMLLGGSLVNMYAKCGSTEDARRVFESLPEKSVLTWTAMMAGYVQQGMGEEALRLYSSMQQQGLSPPDSITFACLLQACTAVGMGALHEGRQLHAQIEAQGLKDDVVLGQSLVNMYTKCGSLKDACSVFDRLPDRNSVTWNAMLTGHTQLGMGQEALSLYRNMQQEGVSPDSVTFVCLLQACAIIGVTALHQGEQLHEQIEERGLQDDVVLGGSLVNMYAKCGNIEDGRRVFNKLPNKNVVAWNAMIAGYAQQGMDQEALSLYSSLQQEGLSPDSVTFVCMLQACANVAGLPLGKQLHVEIEERGLHVDVVVGATLVNMYAKCGSMIDAQQVFDSLPEKTIEAWNALIGGYACQGDNEVVFDLFARMRLGGTEPNGITYLAVLNVCSHAGLVDKGRMYFEVMRIDCAMSPTVEHYTCMMDLLGRAGHLDEALEMAKTIPFAPSGAVWHALLGACLKWDNIEIGEEAFEFVVRLDGKDAAAYVLMANIYARAQMWEEAKEMQARRVRCAAWKKPGQSWYVDTGGVVHTFVVGDKKHPDTESIYARLEQLVPRIKN